MQWAEFNELFELRHHALRDFRGILEDFRAVKHTVPDGVDIPGISEIGDDLLERLRVVGGAAGAYALDEPLGEPLLLDHVKELILERARAGIDYENLLDCLFHFAVFSSLILMKQLSRPEGIAADVSTAFSPPPTTISPTEVQPLHSPASVSV